MLLRKSGVYITFILLKFIEIYLLGLELTSDMRREEVNLFSILIELKTKK